MRTRMRTTRTSWSQSLASRRTADAVGIDCKDDENDDDGDDDDDDDDDGDVCFPEAQEYDHDSPLGEQFANEAQENMQRIIKEELQLAANMAAEASLREERRRLEREAVCYRCESGKVPDNQVMLCDNLLCATIAWHQLCLEPPILEIQDGIWFCPICADNGVAERSVTVNEKLREQEPVPRPAPAPVIPPRDGPRGKSEKRQGGAVVRPRIHFRLSKCRLPGVSQSALIRWRRRR